MHSYDWMGPIGFILAIVALVVALLPISKAVNAGFGVIGIFIAVEMLLIMFYILAGQDVLVLVVGWGFISVLGSIAAIGEDIRRAILKRPAPPVQQGSGIQPTAEQGQ